MQTYPTGYTESHRIAEQIFREILPRHGMAVREEQIALCHEVLDTLYNKEISLCEAGVGTGKTLAYLVGCILWQMHRPERMKLPIVISTSSVALQDAILTEYLPELSDVLLDEGIITAPTTAVVRKGKERFVCDARLAERASLVLPKRTREKRSLRIAENILDMDHIPELSHYDRCRICVPQSCPRDCFMAYDRSYWKDHVTDQSGEVIQQGTLLDQQHFNNMELGISDMTLAGAIMQFKAVQDGYNYADEMHTATLAQTGSKWPFNNTPTTIALAQLRESTNYGVEVTVLAYSGGRLGNIRVTDRARNGFKLVHDGSATTVKVQIRVTGGMTDPAPTE
jgi:hypothetical protein